MLSLKIGYRILNCIMNLWSFIFGFYLSLGIPQFLFKVIFVAVINLSTHSYLEFVCIGCYCDRFVFCLSEWYNKLCENWAGVR